MSTRPSYTKTWHSSVYASISPDKPSLSLSGRTAVITGGGSGIGFAISQAFVTAGIRKLCIIGRRLDILEAAKTTIEAAQVARSSKSKTEIFTFRADISSESSVNEAFSSISQALGQPIDILVSNAGYFSGPRKFGIETAEEWSSAVDINIKGLYFLTKAFIARAAPTNAIIINVSSSLVHVPPLPGFSSYSVTKLAGTRLMQFVLAENPALHIVDFQPGMVSETDLAVRASGGNSMGHIDDVELPGAFAVWLASEEAKFLKGKFVWCNWDVDELMQNAELIEGSARLTIGLNDFPSPAVK